MSTSSLILRTSLAALLALSAVAGQPQSMGDWSSVTGLPLGSELRVSLSGGRTLRGSLEAATPDSLTIKVSKGQEVHQRQDVRRVQLKRPGRRLRNTLVGLGVGAGAGLAVGAGLDRSRSGDMYNIVPNAGVIVLTPLGAIVGTVVGVVLPTGGWRSTYRAP